MPRFHFHLRAQDTIHHDLDGTDSPDIPGAHSHAVAVATELMRNSAPGTAHWSIWVEDEQGRPLFDVPFAEVDTRLANLPAETKRLVVQTCRRYSALIGTFSSVHATIMESRILLARSRRKPHLAYAAGQ